MDETPHQAPTPHCISGPPHNGDGAAELRALLGEARKLCESLGAGFYDLPPRLAEFQQRLDEERFHLAVLGQFKRGKSTLLNALLGEALLPTGVVPLTSIPTFLHAGKRRAVRVFFHDGRETAFFDLTREQASNVLARHVTEKENPKNQLGVARVEVEHPAALLSAGVVMIDTPGIGSTLRHNTEATLNFLPQCDGAIFVVSADPPVTEVEKTFIKAVQEKVPKLRFVMNKIDYLTEEELEEAVRFFDRVLKESGAPDEETIFRVSAKQGLDARLREDALLWERSGLRELQRYLLDFFSREKLRILQLALARKALAVVADAATKVELQRRSLRLSRRELEQRIQLFDSKVAEIEQEKLKMTDLLSGDRRRTVQRLEDLAEALRHDAGRYLHGALSEILESKENGATLEDKAKARLAEEIPEYFTAKLAAFSSDMNRTLKLVLVPYQERLTGLVNTMSATAAELFDVSYRVIESDGRFEELHRPYWVTEKWNTSITPVAQEFLDRCLPFELRKRRLQKRLSEEVQTLVIHNVENLRWATLRNLDDTFRSFAAALDQKLKNTAEATRMALRAAHARRDENATTSEPAVKRLEQNAAELARLENSLGRFADSL